MLMTEQLTPPPPTPDLDGGAWETDPLIGGMIGGRYRVRSVVGRGGMGVVYDALHEELGRSVAIKVVSAAHANDPKVIDRFLREARVVAQIGHPNIVDVHDLGRLEDQRPYLVMERIYGPSFYELLQLHGRMDPGRVAELLEGAGAALEVVHAKGIIHRDIKLENLMLARLDDGSQVVKLLDFGIAAFSQHTPDAKRITAQGMITGTPLYIAPESASGDRPDHRADIYSLAVVAYMMLTGFAPFDSENPVMVLLKKLSEPPPKLSSTDLHFSQVLEDVIARGLARSRDERYQSARDFVRDIKNAAHGPGARVMSGFEASQSETTGDLQAVQRKQLGLPSPAHGALAPVAAFQEPDLSTHTPQVVKVEVDTDTTAPDPVPAHRPATSSTGELVTAAVGDPADRYRRIAMYVAPVLLVLAIWGVMRAVRAPLIEPMESSDPRSAVFEHAPPEKAKPIEVPPVVVDRPAVVPVAVESAEAPETTEPVRPSNPTTARESREALAKKEARAKADLEAREREFKEAEQAAAAAGAAEAARRKPVRESAPPKVTLPKADMARAEHATSEGMKALVAGRLPSAIESFREATNAAPRYAPAWRGLGIANEKLGRKSEALDAFEQYLRLSSSENAGVVREIEQKVEKLKGI